MVVYLIDGNAVCYRAFYSYATRDLKNSKGFPTNVPYGFMLCLRKLIKDFKPDGLAVAFDLEGPTFRHEEYEDYKANREPAPDDLIVQMPIVKQIIEAYNIPIFEKKGYEADDVLGTLSTELAKKGHEVVLVTSDKDACQLVTNQIRLMDPAKNYDLLGVKEVKDKLGVEPNQVIDYLALMGDSSDNIPGVPGIGPKFAKELLGQFGTLKGVYENLNSVKGEAKKKSLKENKKEADLSKQLATIDCKVPIQIKAKDIAITDPDYEALIDVFKELEFRSFLKELPRNSVQSNKNKKYTLITQKKDWQSYSKLLNKQKEFAFDFETTGTDPLVAEPVGMSFCMKDHEATFILFDRHESHESKLKAKEVLDDLQPLFEDSKVKKYGQNIKYEMMILRNFGIHLKGIAFDTMVASYLINPSKPNHNLTDLTLEHLDEQCVSIEALIGSGKKQITMAQANLEKLYQYGCQDSDVVWRLVPVLRKKIHASKMDQLLNDMEIPLIEVLSEIEYTGIELNVSYLRKFSNEMESELKVLKRKIYKLAGSEFNINSPKQLGEILFQKLGLPVVRRTKTGPSTDMEVLKTLSENHEIPALIIHYRELSKLKSTYVDAMPELVNPKTHRIHSSFNQTVTATGRLSSSDPNLQNIPIRTEEGIKVRKAFVAPKGQMLVSADYSQIELRILAHLSGDEHLIKAFKSGEDIHAYTASLVFGVPQVEVTSQMRSQAKTVNFGVLYGISPFGLAKSLNISHEAARDFINSYFDRYPDVKVFLDDTIKSAKKTGFVETLFKRRRYIPDIESKDMRMRQFAERTAINAPVQGTASDLVKVAMIQIHERLKKDFDSAQMLIQVHDELVFEAENREVDTLSDMVKSEMEGAIELDVPIEVTLKSGPNWMEMKELVVQS